MKNKLCVHLVSDSTCETLSAVKRSVSSQFSNVEIKEFVWTFVQTEAQIKKIIVSIKEHKGIVLYSILQENILKILQHECEKISVYCIPVLTHIIHKFAKTLNYPLQNLEGRSQELDQNYFDRMQAINYTIAHDDGCSTDNLSEADVILVGPSRTSKSPTCVYLGYRGLKAANIPFIMGCQLPDFSKLNDKLIIGLIIKPNLLIEIRKNRLLSLKQSNFDNYINEEYVKNEIIAARKFYLKNKWPILDITRKSIEETASCIISLFSQKNI